MMIRFLTRRAAAIALGAFALAPTAVLAQPPAPATFRAVQVDIGPLRSSTGDPTAAWVAASMPAALAQALGAHLRAGRP